MWIQIRFDGECVCVCKNNNMSVGWGPFAVSR